MRTRVLTWLVALVTVAGLATGCSGDDSNDSNDSSATSDSPGGSSSLPSKADLTAYFTAVAGYDVSGLQKAAADIAADGSPAQAYATYQSQIAQAITAAGQDPGSFAVEASGDGYEACGSGGTNCATWADLQGQGGRLVDFTVNQADVADSLVDLTGQAPVDVEGLFTVQPEYAYRSPLQKELFVTVQLNAQDLALAPLPAKAVYIEGADVLSGAGTSVAGTIAAGSSGFVTLAFTDAGAAELDGQVTFPVKVGGASAQSVGFSLGDS